MRRDQSWETIELILSDVDGVLTDGRIVWDNQGVESKAFHIRDGMAIHLWKRAGHQFGLITSRSSRIVQQRATELDITIVRQGVEDKLSVAKEIMQELGIESHQVCYVGDDLPDIPLLRGVGLGVATADAAPEARDAAHYTAKTPGGNGVLREIIEMILKRQKRWEGLIHKYVAV